MPFGPPMWQAEADTELTLSGSPTTAVGQKALFHGTSVVLHSFVYINIVVFKGYNMLFRDFFLETASEGLFIAKTASEGNFMPKIVPQTSIYREIFPQKILT